MAAEVITGTAILHGIQNSGSAITLTGAYASFILEKVDGQHHFDQYTVKDPLGNDVSIVAFNEYSEITVDITISGTYPSPNTRTQAATQAYFIAPLTQVTLANMKTNANFGSTVASQWNGLYVYVGDTRIAQASGQPVKLSGMKLRRYADQTQNAALTTPVSG